MYMIFLIIDMAINYKRLEASSICFTRLPVVMLKLSMTIKMYLGQPKPTISSHMEVLLTRIGRDSILLDRHLNSWSVKAATFFK